ncbi:hypothetical protein SteCoe_4724 [Stentor coeruleus]|uniref:cGMP-dependent protein kinase n=1 Tax=Stentor coeruleus TaxID=5963 RepID=A0A1R2CTY6_9CILI|nr:hypothetical protein SteCoe_4724 [Stentor coeruleus]
MGACMKKTLTKPYAIAKVQMIPASSNEEKHIHLKNSEFLKNDSTPIFGSNLPRRSSLVNFNESTAPDRTLRRGSFSGAIDRKASFTKVEKTEDDKKLIQSALQKHFIFSNLTDLQIDALTIEMKQVVYPSQKIIFEQNSIGDNFFIIAKGKVEVVINLKVAAVLNTGDSFGEVALLHETPRTATIIALQETKLWALDRMAFRKILQNMSHQKFSENLVFIENIQMFKSLTKKQKESLANAMTVETYKPGYRILREGDTGDFMYIIKEGTVIVTKNGTEIRKLIKNDYFGEQALLQNNFRTASVTAVDKVICLSINSEGLYATLGSHLQEIIHTNTQRMAIDANPYLSRLTSVQINNFVTKTKVTTLKRGHTIKIAGCPIDFIIIVLRGCIGTKTLRVKYLEIFSFQEVLDGNKALMENIVVFEDCDIAEISKMDFEECIGGRLNEVLERNDIFKVIKDIQIFQSIDSKILEKVVKMFSVVRFRNKDVIFTQNQPGDSLFIVKSGNVDVVKNGVVIRTVGKNDYFGERSLIFNTARSATIRAIGNVECWILSQSQFMSIFNSQMKAILQERIDLQDDKIEIQDLCTIKLLHQGRVANYFLCVNQANKKLYILKTMQKSKIINLNLIDNVLSQKKINSQMNHGMIVKLVKTFKDSARLSMLIEYVAGVDFSEALKSLKKLNELDSRFYAGCLILIIEYLHDHEIVYRDLNLMNIIIDRIGYPKLINFSCAKSIQSRTFTLIGTPHYIAPEMIAGNGYSFPVDFWSLGITLYITMYGMLPFGNSLTDPMMIYQEILNKRLIFSSTVDPLSKSRDLISSLLIKNPNQRINAEKIKSHPWFVSFNWDLLSSKQIKAPFLPVVPDFSLEAKSAIDNYRTSLDEIIRFESQNDFYIPRFNVNNKWDADF